VDDISGGRVAVIGSSAMFGDAHVANFGNLRLLDWVLSWLRKVQKLQHRWLLTVSLL
jgi:hypothetical protein